MARARRLADLLLLIAVLLGLWQALHLVVGDAALSSPRETATHALDLLDRPRFWGHVYETLRALGWAVAISSLGGVGIGVWLGAHRLAGQVAEPMLIALYAIPKVTLYPLILLIFGLGISAKIAFGAIHGIIPITIFTMNAVKNIRPIYVKAARSLNLSPLEAARRVLLPAAVPETVSGLRIGLSLTLLGVLIGEMFASQRGLGFLIMNAIGLDDVKTVMAVMLLLAVTATLVNAGLLALDRHLHKRV